MTDIVERLQAEIEARKTATEKVYLEQAAEIRRLRAACELFTEGANDAVKALNAAGIACPASIALAAEKARRALEPPQAENPTKPCPHWPGCGCGTQSGPHTCEYRALEPKP